jgi:hypothetical protein
MHSGAVSRQVHDHPVEFVAHPRAQKAENEDGLRFLRRFLGGLFGLAEMAADFHKLSEGVLTTGPIDLPGQVVLQRPVHHEVRIAPNGTGEVTVF